MTKWLKTFCPMPAIRQVKDEKYIEEDIHQVEHLIADLLTPKSTMPVKRTCFSNAEAWHNRAAPYNVDGA